MGGGGGGGGEKDREIKNNNKKMLGLYMYKISHHFQSLGQLHQESLFSNFLPPNLNFFCILKVCGIYIYITIKGYD